MAHLGFRGRKENWKYEEGDKNKNTRLRAKSKRPNGTAECALLWGKDGVGKGGASTGRCPPLGGQVGAGGLLLGVRGWAAELVQHGLIPEGRAEGEGQGMGRQADTKALLP